MSEDLRKRKKVVSEPSLVVDVIKKVSMWGLDALLTFSVVTVVMGAPALFAVGLVRIHDEGIIPGYVSIPAVMTTFIVLLAVCEVGKDRAKGQNI